MQDVCVTWRNQAIKSSNQIKYWRFNNKKDNKQKLDAKKKRCVKNL